MKPGRKLKVLKVSHTAAVATYRARERALIKQFPVELELIVPTSWSHLGLEQTNHSDEEFKVHRVNTIGTGNIPLFAFAAAPISRIIKEFQPDIIDIHEEPYSVSGFETVALARQFAPQARLLFYTAQNIYKKYPPPFCWSEQFVYRSCAAAYPCSSEAAEVLRRKGYKGRTIIMPLGVDPTVFNENVLSSDLRQKQRDDNSLSGLVIGYFGRVESYKGIQHLFDAAGSLDKDIEFTIAIIGSGSYSKELEEHARQLGISARVKWLGEKTASEIPQWIALCDCIVVPSLTTPTWKEQFGRAAVESMACGVPTIVSDCGSLPEVVANAGLIVPEADSEKLKEAITSLARGVELRWQLAEIGLSMVREKYLWSTVAEQTFNLYMDISERIH